MRRSDSFKTRTMVLLAVFTAIVVALQLLGAFIKFGTFSISLVMMPIAVGAALMGPLAGGWLGFAFGAAVLVSGDAAPFMAVHAPGTIAVVLGKGLASGLAAGLAYRLLAAKSKTAAAVAAAAAAPIANTAVFVAGSYIFFLPTIAGWAEQAGHATAASYVFIAMIGLNFLLELGSNLILSPVVIRLVQYGRGKWS